MKSKRAKATDISQRVKEIVWERDKGRCVVCGNKFNVMPNAHILSRSHGGLGIETNIVTLCSNFTINKCHYKFDNGTKKERQDVTKDACGAKMKKASCGAVAKFKAAKCGSKLKKHL